LRLSSSVCSSPLHWNTTAYEAVDAYMHWLRIIIGAETSIAAGRTGLDDIYASERKTAGGDFLQNFM
jgi:hypothetical protein